MVHKSEDLTHRIEHLERDARRWRCAAVILGGLVGMVGLAGATAPPPPVADEIVAKRFVLVDEAGIHQGELRIERNPGTGKAQPQMVLYGTDSSAIQLDPAGLTVIDSEYAAGLQSRGLFIGRVGRPMVALEAGSHGPRLMLADTMGTSRASMGADPNGAWRLGLADATGKVRAVFVVGNDNVAGLSLYDAAGRGRVVLLAPEKTSSAPLVLFDKDGKVLFKAP